MDPFQNSSPSRCTFWAFFAAVNIEAVNTEARSDDYVTDQSIFVAPFSEGECSDDKLALAQK